MLSAKVPQRRGERTALQAERPHAAGGKIRDIMDVRETLISKTWLANDSMALPPME